LKLKCDDPLSSFAFRFNLRHYSQEPIAMNNLKNFHKNGGWVLLQNIHLTIDWTNGPLEKAVDKLAEGAHEVGRCRLNLSNPR
jgi:dynein heavy chain